jgi:hypothetical protein
VQIVTDEPLLECRVLASVVGPNREEALRAAMAAAGVTELVETPRPSVAVAYQEGTVIRRVYVSQDIKSALVLCEQAADGLIAAIRRDHVWFKCEQPCETPYCVYCEGGLAYCVVCKQGEAELEPRCPGAPA